MNDRQTTKRTNYQRHDRTVGAYKPDRTARRKVMT